MHYRLAETAGETYPNAVGVIIDDGILIFCNVQIAWAGADPAVAKRRIDKAVQAVRDVYNVALDDGARSELVVEGVEINSTAYQGVVQISLATHFADLYGIDADLQNDTEVYDDLERYWADVLRAAGVDVMDLAEFRQYQ